MRSTFLPRNSSSTMEAPNIFETAFRADRSKAVDITAQLCIKKEMLSGETYQHCCGRRKASFHEACGATVSICLGSINYMIFGSADH